MKNRVLFRSLVVLFVLFLAVGLAACQFKGQKKPAGSATATATPLPVAPQLAATEGYSAVAEKAVKSVVNVSTTKVIRMPQNETPFHSDPFFRHFFGERFFNQVPRERRERALGSGVIVTKDGYILTNNHVVSDAEDILVVLGDGRELTAKVIGSDSKADLAVLKVEADNLEPLTFGQSSTLRLGEVVLAIGNPFGLSQTVTMGIVSALGRANVGILDYEDFIQTDAAINPGNSGGALINTRGELVGINTAIFSRSGGYQGIGFAIPIDMARTIMESLIKYGKVQRGYLGTMVQDVKAEMADQFGLEKTGGALVSDVVKNSPAAEAGLQRGDVIVKYNGKDVIDSAHLRNMVSQTPLDTTVTLEIIRGKAAKTVEVTIKANPDQGEEATKVSANAPEEQSDVSVGMTVANITPRIQEYFDLPGELRGVVIAQVREGSIAADAGLQAGDVILEVNRLPVNNVAEFKRAIDSVQAKKALLLVYRNVATSFVVLRIK